jgi:hypothetical protein
MITIILGVFFGLTLFALVFGRSSTPQGEKTVLMWDANGVQRSCLESQVPAMQKNGWCVVDFNRKDQGRPRTKAVND